MWARVKETKREYIWLSAGKAAAVEKCSMWNEFLLNRLLWRDVQFHTENERNVYSHFSMKHFKILWSLWPNQQRISRFPPPFLTFNSLQLYKTDWFLRTKNFPNSSFHSKWYLLEYWREQKRNRAWRKHNLLLSLELVSLDLRRRCTFCFWPSFNHNLYGLMLIFSSSD